MKTYWDQLNERERWALGIGVVITVLYVFYLWIYAPLTRAVAYQQQQLLIKQETLIWMQKARLQFQPKKVVKTVSSSQLLTILAIQLNATSFKSYAYQLQQTGSHDIQLSFDKVPYNEFLLWLHKLSETYAVTIKQMTIQGANAPGLVKLLVVLATTH
ncbi:MAG: type II secretion system protein M [Legionellales bacterium]|nr:type II secretion system protein M [Legionellales bacterium]